MSTSSGIIASLKNSLPPPPSVPADTIDITDRVNWFVSAQTNTSVSIGSYADGGIILQPVDSSLGWSGTLQGSLGEIYPPPNTPSTLWVVFKWDQRNFFAGTKSGSIFVQSGSVGGGGNSANNNLTLSIPLTDVDTTPPNPTNIFMNRNPESVDPINTGGAIVFIGVTF